MNAPLGQIQIPPDVTDKNGVNEKNKGGKLSYTPYIRQGLIGIFLLVFVLGGWAAMFKIKGAVIAPGQIVVEGKPKTIQHLDGGIVGEILVKNADRVKKGQVLLRLDPTAKGANKTIIEKRLYEALARSDRLKAERDGLKQIKWSSALVAVKTKPTVAEILSGQTKLFQARRKSAGGQIAQLRQRVSQSREQIKGLNDLIASKRSQSALIQQEIAGLKKLLVKGYASKTRILALERELARLGGDITTHQSDISRTKSAIGETEIQILQIKKDMLAEVLTTLRQTEGEINDLKEQLVTASDQLTRVDITSPVDGIVHNLEVTTIGGVVTPGQPLMQIIPLNDRLVIEAHIAPKDIDNLYIGQPARINLSAFNRRTTPQLNGKVIETSADVLRDQITGQPYYQVQIEIPDAERQRITHLTLIPGMPAEAFIQTEDRTVLSYLLKPFKDQLGRAFREE